MASWVWRLTGINVCVPDHITKSMDNAKKLKLLTAAKAEDKMGNKDHERNDELEMQKCEICDMQYEMCGTYLTTRSNDYEKEVTLPKTSRDKNRRNLLQHDDGYVYQIANPTVNKETYKELSGTRWYFTGVKRIWGYWMQANRRLLSKIKKTAS